MKHRSVSSLVLVLLILSLAACSKPGPVLSIKSEISEYSPMMSSTVGIPLTAVSTLDLKNKNYKFHWITEAGTFLKWNEANGFGRVEILGSDVLTNLHKVYWSMDQLKDIPAASFQVRLTIEELSTGNVIAQASLTIHQPSPNRFTILQ